MTQRRVIFVDPDIWTRNTTTEEQPMNIPRDVVAPTPPSRETILGWNNVSGSELSVGVPGEMDYDNDGFPNGFGPTTRYSETVGKLAVYRDQLDHAGLTPDDVPNLTVYNRRT